MERIHGSWRELFGQPDGVRGQPDEVRGQPDEMYQEPGEVLGQPHDVRGQPDEVHGQPDGIYYDMDEVRGPDEVRGQPDEMYDEPDEVRGQPDEVRGQPDEVDGQTYLMYYDMDEVRDPPDEVRGLPDEVRGQPDGIHDEPVCGQPEEELIYGGHEVYAVLDDKLIGHTPQHPQPEQQPPPLPSRSYTGPSPVTTEQSLTYIFPWPTSEREPSPVTSDESLVYMFPWPTSERRPSPVTTSQSPVSRFTRPTSETGPSPVTTSQSPVSRFTRSTSERGPSPVTTSQSPVSRFPGEGPTGSPHVTSELLQHVERPPLPSVATIQAERQSQETISNSTTESDDINNKDEEIQTVIYRELNSREATFIRTRSANTSRRRQTASVSRSSSDVSYELNLLSDGPPSHSESDTSDAEPNSVRQYSPSRPGRVNIANVQRRREAFNSSARWVSRNKMPEQSEPRDPPRALQECHRRMLKQVPTSTQSLPDTLAENPDVRRTQRSYGWPCVQETGSVSGVEEACGVEHNRGARYREIQDNHSTRPPSRHSVVKVKADVDVNCHPALLVILGGIVCFCLISLWLIGYSVRR